MRALLGAAAVAATLSFLGTVPSAAGDGWYPEKLRQLSRAEQKIYHECVFAVWVNDYCKTQVIFHVLDYEAAFQACVIANNQDRSRFAGPDASYWYVPTLTRTSCWRRAQGGPYRW